MKYSLLIKNIMFQTGIMSLFRRFFNTGTAAILRYHSVAEPEDNYYATPGTCITPKEFESQIRFLSENYNIVSLDTIADCIEKQQPFPEKTVVLTFDDGYRDNYQAYRIMKKYNVQGTFYIVAGCIGNGEPLWLFEIIYIVSKTSKSELKLSVRGKDFYFPLLSENQKHTAFRKIIEIIKSNNLETREQIRTQLKDRLNDISDFDEKSSKVMLTWEQVQEMSCNGMTIGGHTMTHLNLPNADPYDMVSEIEECKKMIEQKTGNSVRHFSYPNGGKYDYYNESVTEAVKKSGYITATTSNNGVTDLKSDPFELSRIRITNHLPEIIYQVDCEPLITQRLG
ncbi:MAG: polysaccharide deacetylase family protein [Desulfobacterales bacterium]|nr:polysaccharide deacetylase family protein [Desulfobacterales bacterium]